MAEGNGNGNGRNADGRVSLNAVQIALAVPVAGAMFLWMNSIETRLQKQLEREFERNNRLEREMGGAQMIDDLFKSGKLKME